MKKLKILINLPTLDKQMYEENRIIINEINVKCNENILLLAASKRNTTFSISHC